MTFFQIAPIFRKYLTKWNKENPQNKSTMRFCVWLYIWNGFIIPIIAAIISWNIMIDQISYGYKSSEDIIMGISLLIFLIIRYWKLYWLYKWVSEY